MLNFMAIVYIPLISKPINKEKTFYILLIQDRLSVHVRTFFLPLEKQAVNSFLHNNIHDHGTTFLHGQSEVHFQVFK